MRTVVLSDLHLGDAYGADLMRYPAFRDRLWQELAAINPDRILLLGDVWELTFQRFEIAVQTSQPFFAELAARHPGIEVCVVPGNHDHHLVARAADELRERTALRQAPSAMFQVAPAERLVRALASGVQVSSAYPLVHDGRVCLTHGHYATTHLTDARWRSMDRLQWMIRNEAPKYEGLDAADYEALMSPLYELCYQVAQLPDGVAAQREVERRLEAVAQLAMIPGKVTGQLGKWAKSATGAVTRRPPTPVQPETSMDLAPVEYLRAIAQVAANLRLEGSDTIVFAHTHVPVDGERLPGDSRWQYFNCGSWFYDYREAVKPGYWDRACPGTLLIVESDSVQLRRVLSPSDLTDFRPLSRIPGVQLHADHATRRLRRRLPNTGRSRRL